ncbi:MAG: hypothetical protein IJ565_04680 [Bacilli bacterium]|nr:hypothetical protein [Bacilli bacterium]
MVNFFFILIGFILSLVGSTYAIGYLNLLSMGYNLVEYVNFICRRIECWYLVVGLTIMVIAIYMSGKDD